MEKIILEASKREVIGKKVKVLRREGKIPAVMYGTMVDSTPLVLEAHSTTQALRSVTESTIVYLNIDGTEQPTLVRDKQIDFIRGDILHLDFLAVSRTEKIRTNVPLELVGESPAVEEFNALVVSGLSEIEVEAFPQDLPESIQVDISGLSEIGMGIYVKDLAAIDKVEVLTDPEELVATTTAVKEEVIEEPTEEVELEEGAAEPEVIEHGKQEEEVEE